MQEVQTSDKDGIVRRVSYYDDEASSLSECSEGSTILRRGAGANEKKRKRRHVCFDTVAVQEYEGVRPSEHADTWYTVAELNGMKRDVKRLCRRRDLEETLNDAYTAEPSSDDQFTAQKELSESQYFHEQRGMERFSSRTHAFSRALSVIQVKSEVFLHQAQQTRQQTSDDEALARACTAASAPAARFARMLGQIDELAVYKGR